MSGKRTKAMRKELALLLGESPTNREFRHYKKYGTVKTDETFGISSPFVKTTRIPESSGQVQVLPVRRSEVWWKKLYSALGIDKIVAKVGSSWTYARQSWPILRRLSKSERPTGNHDQERVSGMARKAQG